jgi:hypothetical protein
MQITSTFNLPAARVPRRDGRHEAAVKLPSILWQEPEDILGDGWTAGNKGKPTCIPGRVNKVLANVTRPIPYRTQYTLGRTFNPFA